MGPIVPYFMPRDRSIDIDNTFDFNLLNFYLANTIKLN